MQNTKNNLEINFLHSALLQPYLDFIHRITKERYLMKNKPILLMLLSALSFSSMQIIVKLLIKIPLMEKVFFRNLISLVVTYMVIKKNKLRLFGSKENRRSLFYRSIFGYLGVILFFYATSQMLTADAAMLNKLSPIFVAIFAHILLKEKIKKINIYALIISFAGAWLVIKPQLNLSVIPAAAGLLSAAVSGAAYIFITDIGKKESIYTVVFHFSFLSVICSIPFIIFSFALPNLYELTLLIMLGALAALGQIALTYAYKSSEASDISIYDYTNIIFSSVLGYIFLSEIPDLYSIIGGSLIIAASIIVFIYNKRNN